MKFGKASYYVSLYGMMALSCLALIIHILVLAGIIPQNIVWGGRIMSREELFALEAVSLLINGFILFLLFCEKGWIRALGNRRLRAWLFGLFSVIFLLNTLGNLASKTSLETTIFTPLTLILTLMSLRLAFGRSET